MNDSHGAELWNLHTGLDPEDLAQLVDLEKIPRRMKEIERKYHFPAKRGSIDGQVSQLFARIGKFVDDNSLKVASLVTFVGIDQYYIFNNSGKEFHFRYRSGANRPPQLTVKYQISRDSNMIRGEINLPVERADPSRVRAFMSVIAAVAGKPSMFVAQQSGNIWTIVDPASGMDFEIVAYRVHRFVPSVLEGVFAEIEPLESHSAEDALKVIAAYEKKLGLKRFACEHSIAELFRPGNERLLLKSGK